MVFNSWAFVFFFLLVYTLYLLLWRNLRAQNLFLLIASYAYYCAWDWRFAGLLLAATMVDYGCGLAIGASKAVGWRRFFLGISLVSNLGMLGFFKYYNFFLDSMNSVLGNFGLSVAGMHLQLLLPLGLSFFTLKAISYTVGVYRREMEPERSPINFALMIAFFPTLVAGPIERAKNLLEQIRQPRTLDEERFQSGCWLILWGLWKKIVLADNLAVVANQLFARSETLTAGEAYLAIFAFTFQLYIDFSAYSDIARGVGRLMGFELTQNFHSPFFAVGPSDYWRRWHISFSNWLRDYIYFPLGGSRNGTWNTYRNLMITMILCGLWHGAAWNFIWWGVFNGLLLCAGRMTGDRPGQEQSWSLGRRILTTVAFFQLVMLGRLLFRCNRTVPLPGGGVADDSFAQIIEMLTSFRNGWALDVTGIGMLTTVLCCVVPLLIIEAIDIRNGRSAGEFIGWRRPVLVPLGAVMLFTWVFFGISNSQQFIYFQF